MPRIPNGRHRLHLPRRRNLAGEISRLMRWRGRVAKIRLETDHLSNDFQHTALDGDCLSNIHQIYARLDMLDNAAVQLLDEYRKEALS